MLAKFNTLKRTLSTQRQQVRRGAVRGGVVLSRRESVDDVRILRICVDVYPSIDQERNLKLIGFAAKGESTNFCAQLFGTIYL